MGGEPVGGKAQGLAHLIALGLPVPAGFVILGARPGALPPDLAGAYASLGRGPVAVRSSAIGEDGAEASFAGQYETLLGVEGESQLVEAVERCLDSLASERAAAYGRKRSQPADGDEPAMCVVVQRMVEARAAGVLFTAEPASGRRARAVIDAVEGLGEALVAGHASPDHYVVDRSGRTRDEEIVGEAPIVAEAERRALLAQALHAEAQAGMPLDLEWAIDTAGAIHWLQARPITSLGPDPNELDTPLEDREHVYTRCNVGEMFPGACTPLSYSFTARGVEVGMQRMHQRVGIQGAIRTSNRFIAMSHGHLFLNLSTMSETATHALGSSSEQLALSVCGRPIDEFEIHGGEPPSTPRRLANGLRYVVYLLGRGRARSRMKALVAGLSFPERARALDFWREIDQRFGAIYDAMDWHLVSSASSGVLTPTLLGVVSGGGPPSEAHHAEVASLLAGAEDVESADIIAGVERIQARLMEHADARAAFIDASPEDALAWIRSPAAGGAGSEFARYLERHGHRAIKELELRQREWAADPIPLVKSIQIPLRARAAGGTLGARPDPPRPPAKAAAGGAKGARGALMRWLTAAARGAVRSREETKSGLVAVTTRFKQAYRALAAKMVAEGLLPDEDAIYFLTHDELGRLLVADDRDLVTRALGRREVFAYQASLVFPDVFQGDPEPVRPVVASHGGEKRVSGAPVSRGRVVGRVRIVRRLEDAEDLEVGEILVAPITDVGWTPYFSLISGLVTDVGSAVSHGAVVAREYGLPAVVNTRTATSVFETGDLVLLDGERGVVCLAGEDDGSVPLDVRQ